MNNRITKRAITVPEQEFLARTLKSAGSDINLWIAGGANTLVIWAVSMLLFVFSWKFIAWVVRKTLGTEIGWSSSAAVWTVLAGALVCGVIAVVSSVRWVRKCRENRPNFQAELEAGQVIEEFYEFTAAKRFQEPEHGGLIYFLRTTEDNVLVLYDDESQDFGAQGEDPLSSKFKPCTELSMVRTPKSGIVISKHFSGATLDAGDLRQLSIPSRSWPESETYCKIRWDDLEVHFCRSVKKT